MNTRNCLSGFMLKVRRLEVPSVELGELGAALGGRGEMSPCIAMSWAMTMQPYQLHSTAVDIKNDAEGVILSFNENSNGCGGCKYTEYRS